MKTLQILEGDLVIDSGAPVLLTGNEAVRQRLMNALRLDKGSWYFNPDRGIPWFEIYNKKSVSERLIRSNVERILKADAEVTNIVSLDVTFNRSLRKIEISFEVETKYGTTGGTA